jgi:hypothetical protein
MYQQPQPQYYYPPQPTRAKYHGLAIAGFVCALVGLVFGLGPAIIYIFTFVLAVLGLVFGLIGRQHTLGKWAIALAVVAFACGIWQVQQVNKAVNEINDVVNQTDQYFACIDQAQTIAEMDLCDVQYGG